MVALIPGCSNGLLAIRSVLLLFLPGWDELSLPFLLLWTKAQGLSATRIAASWFQGAMSPPACSLDGCLERGMLFGMEESNLLGIELPVPTVSRRFS